MLTYYEASRIIATWKIVTTQKTGFAHKRYIKMLRHCVAAISQDVIILDD